MNQDIIQKFGSDISVFEKNGLKMIDLVDKLNQSASNIKFGSTTNLASDYAKLKTEISGVNTTLGNQSTKLSGQEKALLRNARLIKALTDLSDKYDTSLGKVNDTLTTFITALSSADTKIKDTTQNVKDANGELKNLNTNLRNTTNAQNQLNGNVSKGNGFFGSMFGTIQRLIPFLSALFVLNEIKEFFNQLYQVNKQFELFEAKASAALKQSKLLVKEYYGALQRIDIKSLFDIEELETGLIKLLNRGSNFTEKELQSFANTAQAIGTKGAQSFNQIVEALLDAQVGQFKRLEELGVGVDARGEKLRLTFNNVTSEVDKSVPAITNYILNLDKMNGAYLLAETAGQTLEGRMSSLKTSFDKLIVILGQSGGNTFFKELISQSDTLLKNIGLGIQLLTRTGVYERTEDILNRVKDEEDKKIQRVAQFTPEDKRNPTTDSYNRYKKAKDALENNNKNIENSLKKLKSMSKEVEEVTYDIITGKAVKTGNKYKDGRLNLSQSDITKNRKELENTLRTIVAITSDSQRLTNTTSAAYGKLVLFENELKASLNYNRTANEVDPNKANKAESLATKISEAQKRVAESEIDRINRLNERKLELEKRYMTERLRFMEQGSAEYLLLKKEIDLKEIELDKQKSLDILKNSMIVQTVDKKGRVITNMPSDSKVQEQFKLLGFEKQYQESREQIIEETDNAILERTKKFQENIQRELESSLDKELRSIRNRYQKIREENEKLNLDLLASRKVDYTKQFDISKPFKFFENTPELTANVQLTRTQIELLEKYEIGLARLKRSQTTPEQASRNTKYEFGESRQSFELKKQLNSTYQNLLNNEQLLDYVKSAPDSILGNETLQELIDTYKIQIESLVENYKSIQEKASARLSIQDEIFVNLFNRISKKKIKKIPILDPSTGGVIGESISDNDKKSIDSFKSELVKFAGYYSSFIDKIISLEQKKEKKAEENIASLKTRLEKEEELRGKGLANSTESLKAELKKQQEAKAEAEKRQIALNKNQVISNSILQGSELALATARLFSKSALAGPLGIPAAVIGSLSMLAFFASAITQIKSLNSFGEGGEIDYGFLHSQGGTNINAEKGEFVLNRHTTQQNKGIAKNLNNIRHKITAYDIPKLFDGTGVNFTQSKESINAGRNSALQSGIINQFKIGGNAILEKKFDALEKTMQSVVSNTSRIPKKTATLAGDYMIVSDSEGLSIEKIKIK